MERIDAAADLAKQLTQAVTENATGKEIQSLFLKCRLAYKKTEFLAEYYSPVTAKSINGAPIAEPDADDQHRISYPEGFQVIEPHIFPVYKTADKKILLEECKRLNSNFDRLKSYSESTEFADPQIFDAIRLQVFRIVTLGISGFDAAIAQNSMEEARSSLSSIKEALEVYKHDLKQKSLYDDVLLILDKSSEYLSQSKNFNSFNRMAFITDYANPLSATILKINKNLGIKNIGDLRALKADASTLFDANAFDADYYAESPKAFSTESKTALGKQLFFDPILSGNNSRACASCHQPAKAFTDGLDKSFSMNGTTKVKRNTPTILNAALQPGLFSDLRVLYLEDQATEVINSPDEMHGSLKQAAVKMAANKAYATLFKNAFPNQKEPVNEFNIRNSLASYIRSLTSLNSRFDKYIRGDHKQMNTNEINGFNLYMGKAKCGTCHFTPLFNGTVPPDFVRTETEVIGVPLTAKGKEIDTDLGRFNLRHLPLHKNSFRTPTVRNSALTAPYMHNGIYNTLEEVVDFYNDGGGVGLGFKIDNQTLPFDKLNLSKKEKANIVSFLKTLTDTSSANAADVTLAKN